MTLTFTVSTNSTCPWNNSLLLIKILIILVRSEQKSSIIVVSFQIFLVWGNLLKTVYFFISLWLGSTKKTTLQNNYISEPEKDSFEKEEEQQQKRKKKEKKNAMQNLN